MSELSRLVEDVHLRDDLDQRSNRRGTEEEALLGHALGSGAQRLLCRTSGGILNSQCGPFGHVSSASLGLWNNVSHIEDLQQSLLDPTSHRVPNPPLDLDTRITARFDVQRERSNCVPQNLGSLGDEIIGTSSAKVTGIHFFLVHLSACL